MSAAPPAPRSSRRRFWRELRDWLGEWLGAALFALLLTQFAVTAVRVDGVSMQPALAHREVMLVPKLDGWAHRLGAGGYARGQIVVFKPPREHAEWTRQYRGLTLPWAYRPYLVKRVIGVPGDTVQVRAGAVYVNGERQAEPLTSAYWQRGCRDTRSDLANTPPVPVPAGAYFVMGDNRSPGGSLDSRVFGPVPVTDIAGRALATVWPLAARPEPAPACDAAPAPGTAPQGGPVHWNPRVLGPAH